MTYKHQKFHTLALFIFLISTTIATNLQLHLRSGSNASYTFINIKNISFSGGNLTVVNKDSSINSFPLSTVGYLNFPTLITEVHEKSYSNYINLYPNPVLDILHLDCQKFSENISQLEIISIDGKTLFKTTLGINNSISVSTLPRGVYICRVKNGSKTEILKFIKI
jgi:hypothetical protein